MSEERITDDSGERCLLVLEAAMELAELDSRKDQAGRYFADLGEWTKRYEPKGVVDEAQELYRQQRPSRDLAREQARALLPFAFVGPPSWDLWEEEVRKACYRVRTDAHFATEVEKTISAGEWDRRAEFAQECGKAAAAKGAGDRAVKFRLYAREIRALKADLVAALEDGGGNGGAV